ncbi:MAG TPA: hypothetical protein VM934_01160 [Pyrinomonadaceae bacterium]|jgi:membrane-anchored glycerophosphoryl diester phosphodiesterase (GDPDase)|nr:hypothetical protein [Pyrinomonadaceae bacterium]
MTPEQNRKSFPATNREFFRLVVKSVLVIGGAAFLLMLLLKLFYIGGRVRADDVPKMLALGGVFGLAVTLWRLRWMKWRDGRN